MHIELVTTTDKSYEKMKALRWRVLLQPIGVPASYMSAEREQHDLLITARENEEVVGCCILSHVTADTVQLRQMAVDTCRQTKGIGTAIIQFAEKLAKEKGYVILMMHARDVVIPFYKKCGYTLAGEGFEEVGIPHHRMQKIL